MKSEAAFRQLVTDLSATDLDITCKTIAGEPFVELTRMVQCSGFDLLLAGTRGTSKWEQFFVGSTSKRLIRKCPSSIWIVRTGQPLPPKVVVASTDFSNVSLKATKEGLAIAQQAGAKFHLVHCIDSKDVPDDVISKIPPGSSLRKEINDEATRRLNQFLQSLSVGSTQIQLHLTWGTPWQEIQKISVQQAADLVVIGTVGRSGIKGLLLGNTAERVLETCDCGVLTVKPDDFVSPILPASEAG
jgi:nucleotide-binding universal stress UspA family protein